MSLIRAALSYYSIHRHTDTGLNSMDDRPRHLRVRTGPGGCWSVSASGRRRAASSSAPPWRESPGERRACRALRALPSRLQTWITVTQSDNNIRQNITPWTDTHMPAVSYAGANVGGRALGVMLMKQHSPVICRLLFHCQNFEITRRNIWIKCNFFKGKCKIN